MTQYNVKDLDQAQALAQKLANAADQVSTICASMKKTAEDIAVLDGTAHLNEQFGDYLVEASTNLDGLVPALNTVQQQLVAIINSAIQFAEAGQANALGNV